MSKSSKGPQRPDRELLEQGRSAMGNPLTVATVRRRRFRVQLAGFGGAVLVLLAARLSGGSGALPEWILRPLQLAGFLVFALAVVSYLRLTWLDRILWRNPWVEWSMRLGIVRIAGVAVTHVVELDRPDWPGTVLKTMPVRRSAAILGPSSGSVVWAAGDPDKCMSVSPPEGAEPLYARRPRLPGMESLIRRLATFPD